jgi:hypothetical protein
LPNHKSLGKSRSRGVPICRIIAFYGIVNSSTGDLHRRVRGKMERRKAGEERQRKERRKREESKAVG